MSVTPDLFKDLYTFMERGVNPLSENDSDLPLDFQALPQLIFTNLNSLPKLFKQIYPECYYGQDIDLHLQMAGTVSVIMNRRIKNPHLRMGFIDFLTYLLPQKKVSGPHEKQNNLYKNDFFNNVALKKYLMHCLILVYVDSEKTDYYGKF